jgi:hypothetical protein
MYLGDQDFTPVPVKWLLSDQHLAELRQTMSMERATASNSLGPPLSEGGQASSTTHFSVIDAARNAVSNTYTLEDDGLEEIKIPTEVKLTLRREYELSEAGFIPLIWAENSAEASFWPESPGSRRARRGRRRSSRCRARLSNRDRSC